MAKRTQTPLLSTILSLPRIEPQLAATAYSVPRDRDRIHEAKYDGYRALVYKNGPTVKILTRKHNDWTDKFRSVEAEVAGLRVDTAIIDGEAYAQDETGRPTLAALREAVLKNPQKIRLYAFDLLYLNGEDLRQQPLIKRKAKLRTILPKKRGSHIHYATHLTAREMARAGADIVRHAYDTGAEGIVSKRADKPHHPGRNDDWIKIRYLAEEDFAILGFTGQTHLTSLVIGYYDEGQYKLVGRITGGLREEFDRKLFVDLNASLRKRAPVKNAGADFAHTKWVKPQFVAHLRILNKDADGLIKRATYLGRRQDILPTDIRREIPVAHFDDPVPDLAPQPKGPTPPPKGAKRARKRAAETTPA